MLREFWRHGSNAVLGVIVLVVLGLDVAGVWRPFLWLVVLGAVLFFASEYGFHRYAFHAPPMHRVPFLLKLQRRLHYDHHVEPSRLDLLFLPLWFVLPNFAVSGAVAWLIWPHVGAVAALIAGMSAAILYYEWVHYVAHIPYRPRTPWGRWVKKYHLWHHFKNERLWFGVTNPSFDFLMRSYQPVTEAEQSETVRKLHG
jgi:4-hydroxysphinganine ceramide fatty acyl 2-hydroxylase